MTSDTNQPIERTELAKAYEFHDIEERWYQSWLTQKTFQARMDEGKKSFSIVIPPPNVTGVLHIGHALNNTLQDILVRYRRMQGYNVLWVPGTDHAGIATQNVVERQLKAEGQDRHQIGRDKFIERVWTWRQESGGQIINQLKRLGCSCDWDRERFTMDEGLSKAVVKVFTTLYNQGLIYKGDYIINWCPRCHTALSDLEVEHEPTAGKLYRIRYPYTDGSGYLVVATTRPETMLGDTAVAVHPEDEHYNSKQNQSVMLPLVDREIPIVFDTHVEKEFGTGALKVTPAHDLNDFEIGRRHDLPLLSVMDQNGVMNEQAGKYQGLDRFKCRKQIVADLEELGLLDGIEDYEHGVGNCYRCHTVVEPQLSKQWFVSIKPLAEKAITAVKNGDIRLHPKNWENTYFDWMLNIRDWCISRQIWWGHQIPAWTCDACGELIVLDQEPESCPKCHNSKLTRETDVLDTWFSSALWPFSTLGWPDKTRELNTFYPTSVLITSFDILFFWVARMIMMGTHFMEEVPFRDVYLHALVRDANGQKMSKSKGNVMDPLVVMDKYGTDAFRFTLTAFAAQGRDIRISEDRIEGYRHFINKIWNASRFALMNLEEDTRPLTQETIADLSITNRWILSRTSNTIRQAQAALDDFQFNEVASLIYQFIWRELCDWYLEWIKPALYSDSPQAKAETRAVLLTVLETTLKLLHPISPFITEEIWHALPGPRTTIMLEPFPVPDKTWESEETETAVTLLMGVIGGIRNIRSEMQIHPSANITALLICADHTKQETLSLHAAHIKTMTKVTSLDIAAHGECPKGAASFIFENIAIFVPMQGLIDIDREMDKLTREREKIMVQLERIDAKLTNEKFMANAPVEIVAKEREKAAGFRETLAKIDENATRLQELKKES
ncbi:MAG: valine--tRNA ligase [Proteobacteria bacterium]|nr:valine--tRNA ligase [Desulfobulbaceae bacterium]MBU4152134.1 valine--tRNA ligase [Pseudomonadota bacterium]